MLFLRTTLWSLLFFACALAAMTSLHSLQNWVTAEDRALFQQAVNAGQPLITGAPLDAIRRAARIADHYDWIKAGLIALLTLLALILPSDKLPTRQRCTVFLWAVAGAYLSSDVLSVSEPFGLLRTVIAPAGIGLLLGLVWLHVFGPVLGRRSAAAAQQAQP